MTSLTAPRVAARVPVGHIAGLSSGTASLVLIVERDPHVRELETHFLEAAGYTVKAATDGRAALALAIDLRPDVIVTEILVAGIDGLALCRQLKANPVTAHIPVLVFSILAATARANDAGANAFLMKPLAKERLLGVVQSLVQARDLAQPQASPRSTDDQQRD